MIKTFGLVASTPDASMYQGYVQVYFLGFCYDNFPNFVIFFFLLWKKKHEYFLF